MTNQLSSPPGASGPRITSQVVFGLMLVAAGVIFTLDNLEIIDARDYIRFWPVVFVGVGAVKLWHASRDGQGWFGGLFFLCLGSWMLLNRVIYFRFSPREFFPMVLVFLGGYLVWRGFGSTRRPNPPMRALADGQSQFSAFAIMGGLSRRSNSQAFVGADLTAVMGGCEIDLRHASIAPGTEAVIEVFAFWGGIDIRVPEDWTVVSKVFPLMGGVDDRTRAPLASPDRPHQQKRLVVRGIVIMGGIGIKNTSPRPKPPQD
jgi:predicted membrane protein